MCQWGCDAACDPHKLTVNFLNVNVISLRVTDGDLLFELALSEDQTFLQGDGTETQQCPLEFPAARGDVFTCPVLSDQMSKAQRDSKY